MSRPRKLEVEVLTLFPGMFEGPFKESLLKKAQEKGLVKIRIHNLRDFSRDKHKKVDDKIFGGGPGMLIGVETLHRALKELGALKKGKKKPLVVYLSPQGEKLSQDLVRELAEARRLFLICGHYEGIDERSFEWVDREVSIGDYVLTGGEIPAMVLTDAVSRMIPGVVKEFASVENDSFYAGRLDCAHYTRPANYKGMKVPEVLLSGDHKAIKGWREQNSRERT